MIFDLVKDFADVLDAMPQEHPRHQILKLLDEAIRRDVHFIDRHPTTFFQCMWNTCWWYDCPEAEEHYELPSEGWHEPPPWKRSGELLFHRLVHWSITREGTKRWLRSIRPPATPLGGSQRGVLKGHFGVVLSVSCSSNGLVATASNDKTIRVWEENTGALLRTFHGHSDEVNAVAFSPTGREVVSGSRDSTVRIWDIDSGLEKQVLRGHTGSVLAVDWSADGLRIASGAMDESAIIWSPDGGKPLAVLTGHESMVNAVRFSPNGEELATCNLGSVNCWNAVTGTQRRTFRALGDEALTYSPDGDRLAVVDVSSLQVINARTGETIWKQTDDEYPYGFAYTLTWSADGKWIAGALYNSGTLLIWDAETGREDRRYPGHPQQICSMAFTHDSATLISAGEDYVARLWHVSERHQDYGLRDHSLDVWGVAWSPDGESVLTGSGDYSMILWDANSGTQRRVYKGHTHSVTSVRFFRDGRRIVSASGDRTIRIWDVASGETVNVLEGHEREVNCAVLSPNESLVASCSADQSVRMWDAESGQQVWTAMDLGKWISKVAFSDDGAKLAAIGLDGDSQAPLRVWDVATGILLSQFPTRSIETQEIRFSRDGKQIYTSAIERRPGEELWWLRCWDVESGECVAAHRGKWDLGVVDYVDSFADEVLLIPQTSDLETVLASARDQSAPATGWWPNYMRGFYRSPVSASWAGVGEDGYLVILQLEREADQ